MKIRPMIENDAEQLAVIEKKYFSIPWSKKDIIDSYQKDNYIFLIAESEENQNIVGYCAMYYVIDEGNITNIVTDEKYRQQGIATKMLSALFKEADNKGISDIYLEVRKSNLKAIEFYYNIGFTNCGIRKRFYEKPEEDAIIMKYSFMEKRS